MEEKILSILQGIQNQLSDQEVKLQGIQSQLSDQEVKLQGIQSQLSNQETRLDNIDKKLVEHDNRFNQLEITIKNEIGLLGQELHTEIQAVYDNVEALRSDINAMEILTTKNAFDIAKLKSVR